MAIVFAINLFCVIALVFCAFRSIKKKDFWGIVFAAYFAGIFTFSDGLIFVNMTQPKEPKAIDVYRGNTTLEITYRDSIPVDTVVVFKTEKL